MTYINAMQCVDGLVGGLDSALAALRDRSQARADQSANLRLLSDYNDLAIRHNALAATVAAQAAEIRALQSSRDDWRRMAQGRQR